jgi:hypothetical protein
VPRNLTAGFIAEASAASNRPIIFFSSDFASSTLRLWNGYGDLTWDSLTWLGNGWFSGIEGGDETGELEAVDMTIVLSGISSTLVSLLLSDQKQGGMGRLYIGFLDSAGAVIANPYLWWQGGYSHAEISEAADQTMARLTYESVLVDMDKPREGRWTHDSQQDIFPGDKGFEYVVAAANWSGQWGGKKEKQEKNNKNKKPPTKGSPKRGANGR